MVFGTASGYIGASGTGFIPCVVAMAAALVSLWAAAVLNGVQVDGPTGTKEP